MDKRIKDEPAKRSSVQKSDRKSELSKDELEKVTGGASPQLRPRAADPVNN